MSSIEKHKEKLILDNFEYGNLKELSEKTGMKINTINGWAHRRGLKRKAKRISWRKLPQDQLDLIKSEYPKGNLDELSKKMGKNKHAISELARKYGIKREIDITRNGSLEPLFSGTLESFYWLGLIAADGYVSKRGHFMLSQTEKDKETVDKLANYLSTSIYVMPTKNCGYNTTNAHYRVNISDIVLGKKLREIFGLSDTDQKTYTGISLDFIKTEEQAVAFLIGFIDGDGSRDKSGSYRIQCHKSWYSTFEKLIIKLGKSFGDYRLSVNYVTSRNDSFANFGIRSAGSKQLRKFVIDHNLPASSRKFGSP